MIENQVIKFGYGDILTGVHPGEYEMTFRWICPPFACGERVEYEESQLSEITLQKVVIREVFPHDLYRLFKSVNPNNLIVHYQGWTFDFTHYQPKSVEVVQRKAFYTVNLLTLAC